MRLLLAHLTRPTPRLVAPYALPPCLLAACLLAACGSPPKPPSVNASNRHPVNAAEAVDLQICKNDLHNTRMLAVESCRLATTTSATLDNLIARQRTLALLQEARTQAQSSTTSGIGAQGANGVYSVRFAFGSTRVEIPAQAADELIAQAKGAPLILLRGRTDGIDDSISESRVARERAVAVRDFLVAGGIDPARIRATYQPVGDAVADNGSPTGRSLNRRVEIELYRALPVAITIGLPVARPLLGPAPPNAAAAAQ